MLETRGGTRALHIRGALAFGALLAASVLAGCGTASPIATVSPSASPSASPSPSPTVPPSPNFTWESRAATEADLGVSWREGCPVGPESLVVVEVAHWTFDGTVETGELVINSDIEAKTRAAFSSLFDQGFPIRSMINVSQFDADDNASMAADNTSAFNCRYAVANGDPVWSNHAYGRAIDINPVENPYVFNGEVMPPNGAAFVDRVDGPGLLVAGGAALKAFLDEGFGWGGVWTNPDYQHVEIVP